MRLVLRVGGVDRGEWGSIGSCSMMMGGNFWVGRGGWFLLGNERVKCFLFFSISRTHNDRRAFLAASSKVIHARECEARVSVSSVQLFNEHGKGSLAWRRTVSHARRLRGEDRSVFCHRFQAAHAKTTNDVG